jgi:DNA repair protein SbcC/Rad50
MRIRTVRAHAFGPFTDAELDLAEGMTVVVGANEAGKSSWHAAIYAALCGMRRGKGAATKDDREFASRHRPWDGERWEVSGVVQLPDGRTVELRHDLAGKVDSSAIDLELGHDVSREIIHDGAPDGSRWLGLDRRAFLAVSCVRQAEILAVTDHAGALQEHLQRAAATAGADETAAAALAAIAAYQREHVGLERRNSTKPLMEAIGGVETAEERHRAAVDAHHEWLARVEQVAELERRAGDADDRVRAAEAAMAHRQRAELHRRLERIVVLQRRHPTPPPSPAVDDELARRVTTAIHSWEHRPQVHALEGPSADELQARLDRLPDEPIGDLEPEPAVVDAHRSLLAAQSRLDAHRQQEPAVPAVVDTKGLAEPELVELARELDTVVPAVDPALVDEVARRRTEAEAPAAPSGRGVAIVAGLVAVVALLGGMGLLAAELIAAGLAVAGTGVLVGAGAAVAFVRGAPSPPDTTELRSAEMRLVTAEQLAATALARREQAAERVRQVGLDPDPGELRRLADASRRSVDAATARRQWDDTERRLVDAVSSAVDTVCVALDARGLDVPPGADAEKASLLFGAYEQHCRERRAQAQAAAERAGLQREIDSRRQAEQRLAADTASVAAARSELFAASVACGATAVDGLTEHQLLDQLQRWLDTRDRNREAHEHAREEWRELQHLLDGSTLDELRLESDRLDVRCAELEAGLPPDLVGQLDLGVDAGATLAALRHEARRFGAELASARGDLAARAERVVPVADAEEALVAARDELARVRRLESTLALTERFMADAQDRIHRDIAPVLAEKVQARLGRVTGARYTDVTVDPHNLRVQVRGPEGRWRDAEYLSQGTAEQVYLLLRVAMSEILSQAKPPLLLDDVTVQSDPVRTRAILDVLHEVSADHQVVVFSQESEVKEWAESRLDGGRDSLVLLPPLRPPS